jgi:hypothetical protein
MVVYFGGYNNGAGNIGQRVVLANVGINGGSDTVNDNFLTDTHIDDVSLGGSTWLLASDTTGANDPSSAIYLITPTTTSQYYVDWSLPATGFVLQTNSNLINSSAWSTNIPGLTTAILGDHVHAVVDKTNLPPSGPLFFRLDNSPTH